jgi:hypothetical protein
MRGLAARYMRTYPTQFDHFGWDVEDLEQELWIRVYEGSETDPDMIIRAAVRDVHNLLRDADADYRSADMVDLYGELDEFGNPETVEAAMDRMVYHGEASYV